MPFDIEEARDRTRDVGRSDPARVRDRIADLARPRLTGSEGAEEIETALRERFDELGYELETLPFSFSTWPGRFGISVAGVTLVLTAVLTGRFATTGAPVAGLVVLVLGLAVAVAPLLLLSPAMDRVPWGRVESRNLLFRRAGSRPGWIVMAHRDSKSQLVPTILRTAALTAAGVSWLALLTFTILWLASEPLRFPALIVAAAVVLGLAGLTLALSWAGNRSPGALDNGTGLAALLEVAERLPEDARVAFLVTDGEELGLAGARDAASRLPPVQGVVNVEGLDDEGVFFVTEGHGPRRRGSAPQLVSALLMAGRVLEMDVHRRRLPHSILVDHLPVAAAGIPAVTLLRGRWRSLMRVHRPGDTVERLTGRGAADGATLLAVALRLLRDADRSHLASPGAHGP